MVNKISLNGTSYHGLGAIGEITAEVKSRGFKKAFVASDPDLVKFGVTAKVTSLLDKEGMTYEIYSDIKPNPTISNVQNGVKAFKKSGADYIIAIGGGSSMAGLLDDCIGTCGDARRQVMHVVQPVPLHCRIYFPQQMVFGHKTRNAHKLYDVTVHFPSL